MTTILAALALAAPPSFAGTFGGEAAPAQAEAAPESSKSQKDMERILEALRHIDDRLKTVEARSRFAANAVTKLGAGSPALEEIAARLPEGSGMDGWVPRPPAAASAAPVAVQARAERLVWCQECGAYMPASHFAAPQAVYQTAAAPAYRPVAAGVYRPAAYQAPAQAPARVGRRPGFS